MPVLPNRTRSCQFLLGLALSAAPASLSADSSQEPLKDPASKLISKKNHPAAAARLHYLTHRYKTKRKDTARDTFRDPRIIGGTTAPFGVYTWMVALTEKGEANLFDAQFCGGSLIHPYWVVTAAHCVEGETPDTMDVVLGAHNLTNPVNVQRIPIAEIIPHPEYQTHSLNADLALLRLATPADPRFTPIPLIDNPALAAPNVMCRLLGWGDTSGNGTFSAVLREVDVPIVSLGTANATAAYSNTLTNYMLPAGFPQGGKDSCQGDSGGPLIVPAPGIPGAWMLAGLVSFAQGCAEPNAYGINTRITAFRSFLLNHIRPSYGAWEDATGALGEWRNSDLDRLSNFGEFAFLTDPHRSDAAHPEFLLHQDGAETRPALRFRKPAASGEVDYSLDSSADLTGWNAADLESNIVGVDPVPGDPLAALATVAAPQTLANPAGFLRVSAQPSRDLVNGTRTLASPGRAEGALTSQDAPHPSNAARFAKTYRLTGTTAGEPVSITGRSAELDVWLELIDAQNGTVIMSSQSDSGDGENGTDERISFTPTAGGSYLVRLSSETNSATGRFSIGVFKPNAYAALSAVSVPSTTNGSLFTTSPLDPLWAPERYRSRDYRLAGSAGMSFTALLDSNSFDAFLEIVDAETGLLVASNDDSGGGLNSLLVFTPVEGVSYIVRVTTAFPNETGAFTLELSTSGPPGPTNTIRVPQVINGSLNVTDQRDPNYPGAFKDDFVITDTTPNQNVVITMTSTQFDTFLFLIDGNTGAILDGDDDGGGGTNSRLSITVPAGANWIIRATSYFDGETGAYTLRTTG